MILTCPECATSYFVDDERIPAQGRSVKCSACGARWRAMPEGAEPELKPEPDFPPPPPAEAIEPIAKIEPEPLAAELPDDDLEIVAAPARAARKTAATRAARPRRKAPVAMIAGAVAVIVALGAAILFRQQVVSLAPGAAAAYAAVGLPVDRLGLVIEQVKSQAVLQDGRPVLSVTGSIRNTRDEAAMAPPIRVSLLDKAGNPVAGKLAQPLNGKIPPGARRYFAIAIPEPPSGSHELKIAFEAAEATAHGAPASDAAPAPHAAEPTEAKPLPPGSPDAIPDHG